MSGITPVRLCRLLAAIAVAAVLLLAAGFDDRSQAQRAGVDVSKSGQIPTSDQLERIFKGLNIPDPNSSSSNYQKLDDARKELREKGKKELREKSKK